MSLIRIASRLGQILTTSELSTRIKRFGSKGLPSLDPAPGIRHVVQLLNLDDPAYAEVPTWITGARDVTSAAGQFPSVGFVAGAARTILDGMTVSVGTTQEVMARYSAQSAGFLVFAVSKDASNQQPQRGLGSTINNSLAALPATVDRVVRILTLANTPYWEPLQVRLLPGQMFEVIGDGALSRLMVTFYGREFPE